MSQKLKLHVKAGSSRCSAVLLMLEAVQADFDLQIHSFQDTKKEEFRKLNPLARVPVLETSEGNLCFTNVIARFIGRKFNKLMGTNEREALEIEHWLEASRLDLLVPRADFIYQVFGFTEKGPKHHGREQFEANKAHFLEVAQVFEHRLKDRKFLVGDSLSAADILLIAVLEPVFRFVLGPKCREKIPNIKAFFEHHIKTKPFITVYGNFLFPEEAMCGNFSEHKKDEHKKDEKKKDEKKEEKKKDEKPKKEEKKEEKPKKEEHDDEEEAKPKEVKYEFPKTDFNLDAFKTLFVNEPDKKKAFEFLWKNLDLNALSIWKITYDKLPTECKKVIQTKNLMQGFMDRAELSRKHAFGSLGVYGDEPELDIYGVWLWKGVDILAPLKEHQQYDVFKYAKLDTTKEEDRKLVEDYWTNTDPEGLKVEGRTVQIMKFFK